MIIRFINIREYENMRYTATAKLMQCGGNA